MVLHEAVTEPACRRVRISNGGMRKMTLYIDVDRLPVERLLMERFAQMLHGTNELSGNISIIR